MPNDQGARVYDKPWVFRWCLECAYWFDREDSEPVSLGDGEYAHPTCAEKLASESEDSSTIPE